MDWFVSVSTAIFFKGLNQQKLTPSSAETGEISKLYLYNNIFLTAPLKIHLGGLW